MEPNVSVIITCFNYGCYLEQCLKSVLCQTYTDYEILVVDDGSTDNTFEIMKKYTDVPVLHYIRQDNQGQAKAKNNGIKRSKGRFVAFLDADDKWDCHKLEKQIQLFSRNSVGIVFSGAKYIDPQDQELDFHITEKYLQPRRGWVTDYMFLDNFVPFSSSIVRRKCFNNCGLFNEELKMGVDWDLWLRLSIEYKFDFIDEPLLFYRMGHAGQMSKNVEERHRCSNRIMKSFIDIHPHAISMKTVKKAEYYTACNRGFYYSKINPLRAANFFLDAICHQPLSKRAYYGMAKLLVRSLLLSRL